MDDKYVVVVGLVMLAVGMWAVSFGYWGIAADGELVINGEHFVRVEAELPAGIAQRVALCYKQKMDYSHFNFACVDGNGKEYPIFCDCASGCRVDGIVEERRRC